ncbi:MAG: hypothetical protein K6E20_06865 [Acholeplasmatales bacterium]|nr:hypothetical protein [Acholeplasmatales bacterium]
MTLKFFNENYNLEDYEVLSCYIKDNKLNLCVNVVAYLELIANGYRPELEVNHIITFIFDLVHDDYEFKKPIKAKNSFKDGILYLDINESELRIENNSIEIIKNL